MAVGTEVVAVRYEDIVAGTPISVPYPVYEALDILVYYGSASLQAVFNTDYTVSLADDFDTFTLTPTASLLAKINNLIAADPTNEENYITVRRELDYLTDSTAAAVRYTPFTSREFERTVLRFQQLQERLNRALVLSPNFVGDQPLLQLNEVQPNASLIVNAAGDAVEAGPTADEIGNAQGYSQAAAASATSAAGSETAAAASATAAAGYAALYATSFTTRDYVTLNALASLDDGTIVTVAGYTYVIDSAATGANSAGNDLGVDGIRHFGLPTPQHFGAVGDGMADDTVAMNAAAATGEEVVVPSGVYRVTGSVLFPGDMLMDFKDGAKIVADTGVYSNGYVLYAKGSVTQISDLGATAVKGSVSITFATAPALAFDDTILIFNPTDGSWSNFRTNYKAGEFCHVEGVSGAVVTLQAPLYDSYVAANVDVYKVTPINVILKNPRIEGGASPLGLVYAEYARNPQVINPQLNHANNSCLSLVRCIDGDVFGGRCVNEGDGGDDYALSLSNSQNITIHGGSWYARRHATASGGDAQVGCVPCRALKYIGSRISNDRASGAHAADMHGNAEHCGYYQCHIMGGVSPQGADVSIVDCDVYGGMSIGSLVYANEVLGGRYRISGNRFHCLTNPQPSGRGVIDFGGNSAAINANTTRDLTVEFTGNTIVSDVLSASTTLVYIRNAGTTKKINVDCSNNDFDVNDFQAALWVRLGSGTAASDFLICDKNRSKISGKYSHYPDANYVNGLGVCRAQAHAWSNEVTTSTGSPTASGVSETYTWRFPREPIITTAKTGSTYIGNRVGQVVANPSTGQAATLVLATEDAVNFAAAQTVTICGRATIEEV